MGKKSIPLAEALLLRKELQGKVDHLAAAKGQDWFKTLLERRPVNENVDDIAARVPLVSLAQVTHGYDWHSRALRLVDGAIQRANWSTEIELDSELLEPYQAQDPDPAKHDRPVVNATTGQSTANRNRF